MSRRRIDTVARVRELRERGARATVAAARRDLTRTEAVEQAAWSAVDTRAASPTGDRGRFLGHRAMLAQGIADARAAGHAVRDARGTLDESVTRWAVAAGEREAVARLDARRHEAERLDAERRAAAELDELVVLRWGSAP